MFKILKNCHTCNAARCQMQFTLEQGEMHNFMITSIILLLVFNSINNLNKSSTVEFLLYKITPYYCYYYGAWLNFLV